MKHLIKAIKFILFLSISLSTFQLQAQSKKTYSKEQAAKLRQLGADVVRNPDSLKLNEKFINAWGINDSTLVLQYRRWINKFPNSYAMPFAIGNALANAENPKAREFLMKAVSLKPDLSEAWFSLSRDAGIRGDSLKVQEYLEKAVKTNPANPDYAFYYASQFSTRDTALYHSLVLDMLKRFPKSQRGAQALYWLAYNEKDQKQKFACYELLNENYAKSHQDGNRWYQYGMDDCFALLLFVNPEKALEIAQLQNQQPHVELANTIKNVANLLTKNNADSANALIQQVQVKEVNLTEPLLLLKAKVADAAHHTPTAYDSLTHFYSKHPSDTLQKAMLYYGAKLGLTNEQVYAHVKDLRNSTAKPATDFSLYNYLTKTKVSLADYRGKVILLTYWFPGCGPCRAEFPHFENVLKKFNKSEVVYLALNTQPSQNDYVIPLIKTMGYSFTPLQDDKNRNKGTLPSPYAPANYLIDQNGRIIFSDFLIDERNERMLELMINESLKNEDIPAIDRLTDSTRMKKND